jgi:hypothetical protein
LHIASVINPYSYRTVIKNCSGNMEETKPVIWKGQVSEMKIHDETTLYLDMPHKPEAATMSFRLDGIFVTMIRKIFEPYLGKTISITFEKEEGKIRKITIAEEKETNQNAKR